MKNRYRALSLMAFLSMIAVAKAQVTTEPMPLQIDSQDVKIFYHADQGNKGLMGLKATDKVFCHTGVITNKSTSPTDWRYVIDDWGKERSETQLTFVEDNLWQLYIGDIRKFYNITDADETVEKLAFVFWTAGGDIKGKTADGGDIFVDVVESGLQLTLESSIDGDVIDASNSNATFTAYCTMNATLTISINDNQIQTASNTNKLEAQYQFTSAGDYTVTATATANGQTKTVTKRYTYLSSATEKAYPSNNGVPVMGPVKNPDGTVTFCIAAPDKNNVMLVGSWNNYAATEAQQMYYTDYTDETGTFRYFWTTISGLSDTDKYIYYFIVDGSIKVADPYARLILDPWNDKNLITGVYSNLPEYPFEVITEVPVSVYQGNINEYNWKVKDFKGPDPSNLIIYELLFRDFTGTEGKADANGTVNLAMQKIQYLKSLGVNAIEVLPIYEFNGNQSWGYNPNFYFAPDKAYGTPDDYKAFIDMCHENGMAVILDMVFNQSDGLHPWYMMYSPSENPFYNQDAPHAYSVLNDWNQGYPLVQKQWKDVLEYWLTEYNFDGFRFDLVKGLGLNGSYANNGSAATDAYNTSRVAEMQYLQDIVLNIKPDAYCINENLAGAREENEMASTGQLNWANMNDPACQFAMGYPDGSNLNPLYAPNDEKRLWGSTVSYLESHDEQRLAYKQEQWG